MAFGPQSRAVEAGLLFIYYLFLFLFLLFYSGKWQLVCFWPCRVAQGKREAAEAA